MEIAWRGARISYTRIHESVCNILRRDTNAILVFHRDRSGILVISRCATERVFAALKLALLLIRIRM